MSWRLVVISGASRGYGRACASAFSKVAGQLHFILLGRDNNELEVTKSLLDERHCIDIHVSDLSLLSQLNEIAEDIFSKPFEKYSQRVYDRVIFINNSGSLGPLKDISKGMDILEFSTAINLNVTSACFLTSEIVKRFVTKTLPASCTSLDVVNVSSLAAVQPFETWGIYCAGKAAREMFHKVVSEENKANGVKVLNYAPGPLDTDMQKQIREGSDVKQETREYFTSLKEENKLIDPLVSAIKLIQILELGTYESGSHIDFYDHIAGVDEDKIAADIEA